MTDKEAKGNLLHAIKWNCMPEKEALDRAYKALENKDVLDKIRAEIEQNAYPIVHGNNHKLGMSLYAIIQVFDKYNVESEEKSEIVISQLRAERDRLLNVLNEIQAEINTPNRGTCDYFIVDSIEEIIDKYKAENEDRAKIDCSKTKCENCTNHNYCDYETERSGEEV